MGARTSCLELCASTRNDRSDRNEVLEALGIGPLQALKQQQLQEDEIAGKTYGKGVDHLDYILE